MPLTVAEEENVTPVHTSAAVALPETGDALPVFSSDNGPQVIGFSTFVVERLATL